jgi:DNA-binding NtrC family response regulator
LEILTLLPRYAATDLPVLIKGEPGTGKELVAEALWALSPRRDRLFHRLNCAALAPELAHSELFGHQRGAFTGAQQSRSGKFRLAEGGTLFLDEVGDLPFSVQPLLLRAVEQGEIEPVGGDGVCRVNVRLIAATNQNLPQLITHGRFRRDLYDRLAVLEIDLPPLRQRGEDVFLLAQHFLEAEARRYERPVMGFSSRALSRLQAYPWPGNVRELRNVITRAVLFCPGTMVDVGDLLFAPQPAGSSLRPVVIQVPPAAPVWGRPEPRQPVTAAPCRPVCPQLEGLLKETQGNVSALARRLQVCTRTVYRWLKACGLNPQTVRTQAGGEFAALAAPAPLADPHRAGR